MFTCPNCQLHTNRLVTTATGLACPICHAVNSRQGYSEAHMKHGGLNGAAKNLTRADVKHIWNRGLSADGKRVIQKQARWA